MSDEYHDWINPILTLTEGPRAALDAMSLAVAAPWLRFAPRGDEHHVLVIPGLGGDDTTTLLLRRFLDERGFHGRPWEQGRNLGLRRLGGYDKLLARLRDIVRRSGQPASIIGHSYGGVLARGLAKHAPDLVRRVVTLGAPIGGPLERTAIWRVYQSVNGDAVERRFLQRIVNANRVPPPVPSTAIFSRTDGVVPWEMAHEIEAPLTENIEVFASHFGLLAHPAVFYALADRLALEAGSVEPFDRSGWLSSAYGPGVVDTTNRHLHPV